MAKDWREVREHGRALRDVDEDHIADLRERMRASSLVDQLRRELEESGTAYHEAAGAGIEVEQWRTEARKAARTLGRPVRTGADATGAWAALTDWPASDSERAAFQVRLRRVAEAASRPPDSD